MPRVVGKTRAGPQAGVQAASAKAKPVQRSSGKAALILSAARDLFTGAGYGATSMDAVAAAADVSKATVYAHYTSKPELFAAVIAQEGQANIAALERRPDETIADALRRLAREAFDLVLAPTTTAFYRMIAAEAPRFPELGRIFYETGPAHVQARLADFLDQAMARHELRREDPGIAAAQFFALICGDLQLRDVMGLGVDVPKARRDEILARGIDSFLLAYQVADAATTPPESATSSPKRKKMN